MKVKAFNDLKYILGEQVDEGEEGRLNEYFYSLIKPAIYSGSKGREATFFRDFETMCNVMRSEGVPKPKKLTVREWFTMRDGIIKRYKALDKKKKPSGR